MKILTTIALFSLFLIQANAQYYPENNLKTDTPSVNFFPWNILPEVIVTDELQLKTLKGDEVADRAEEFQKLDFKLYALKAEEEIAQNDSSIASIKSDLKKQRGRKAIRMLHRLTSLEIENQQLKDDLWNYLHYGLGNWKEFKEEFNEDIQPLMDDLLKMKDAVAVAL